MAKTVFQIVSGHHCSSKQFILIPMEKPAAFQAARQMIRASSNGNAWEVGMTQFRDDPEIGSGIYGLYIVYIYGLCMVLCMVYR